MPQLFDAWPRLSPSEAIQASAPLVRLANGQNEERGAVGDHDVSEGSEEPRDGLSQSPAQSASRSRAVVRAEVEEKSNMLMAAPVGVDMTSGSNAPAPPLFPPAPPPHCRHD